MKKSITLVDVIKARNLIYKYQSPTPLIESILISELLDANIYLKCEMCSSISSFKWRGGLLAIHDLAENIKKKGIITASSGNHGQGLAFAGNKLGVDVAVYVPENANRDKIKMIEALGAHVIAYGVDTDNAKEQAKLVAKQEEKYFIEDGNELSIFAGTGTIAMEIIEELPNIDIIIIPIGNGALIGGIGLVAKSSNPDIQIIGVQVEAAPCMYLSWKEKKMIETEKSNTIAEGISVRVPVKVAVDLMIDVVDDIILVSDDELKTAIKLLYEKTHFIVEPAGAASLAAAIKIKDRIKKLNVALILSGSNIPLLKFFEIVNFEE